MRDPGRLDNFYTSMKYYHKKHCPDLRFGQLMINFNHWHNTKYNTDIFFIEDSKLITHFAEYVDTIS